MKKNYIYKPCVWNVTQLDKNIITQNDNRKIPKIKIITNPTTHPFTLQPFPNKRKKKKKKKKTPISHALQQGGNYCRK